jgi:dTDP-4-amino-4,6-dideoxygalactose transaminase
MELVGEEEIQEVVEVLRARYLYRYEGSEGERDPRFLRKVFTLEEEVARLSGVRYAVAVNSGTSALLVALGSLGIGPGDEVIVPGYTFIASISSIVYARAIPVFAEIDRTFNLDPEDVKRKITPHTRAIMAVHMKGNPARLEELKLVADTHGLPIIEDCCQAFGATYRGRAIGSIGKIGAFSFNAYKTITCGDGGMVITDDEDVYRRSFAFHDQGHWPLRSGAEIGNRPFIGLDFRMTEVQAAVLLAQLRKLPGILERLRANKRLYRDIIADLPGIEFREITDPSGEIATMLTVILPSAEVARKIAADLGSAVIAEAGWHVYNNMEQILEQRTITAEKCPFTCPYYTNKAGRVRYWKGMLPQTDRLLERSLNISIGVSDRGLSASYGAVINDSPEKIREKALAFRAVAGRHLHEDAR